MYWGIYDEYTIRNYKTKGKCPILIRALEPSYKDKIPYSIDTIDEYIDILELYFEDISEYMEDYQDKYTLFNVEMAYKLIEFVNKNKFDEIVIHCSAGISRSSALMICVSRILGLHSIEKEICKSGRFYPNKLVIQEFMKCNYNTIFNEKNYEHKIYNTNKDIWDKSDLSVAFIKDKDGAYKFILNEK